MNNSVYEAARVLNLGDTATLNSINDNYKALLFRWHPDHCKENPEECKRMTDAIIKAYKIMMNYCYNYKFSMAKEDLEKSGSIEDPETFWHNRFGHDPLWGYPK